jgi:hypothetical protein
MFSRKLLIVLAFTVFAGGLAGTTEPVKKHPPACYPCTGYCKTHPNDPRCN